LLKRKLREYFQRKGAKNRKENDIKETTAPKVCEQMILKIELLV